MEQVIEKDFSGWIALKERLHFNNSRPMISEGDVWWYAAGENIQSEINGKSDRFSRPVLVVKKFGRRSFWGVPLTSQPHSGDWYVNFCFQEKPEYAAILQLRSVDISRLYDRIGRIPNSDLDRVKIGIIRLLLKEL